MSIDVLQAEQYQFAAEHIVSLGFAMIYYWQSADHLSMVCIQ